MYWSDIYLGSDASLDGSNMSAGLPPIGEGIGTHLDVDAIFVGIRVDSLTAILAYGLVAPLLRLIALLWRPVVDGRPVTVRVVAGPSWLWLGCPVVDGGLLLCLRLGLDSLDVGDRAVGRVVRVRAAFLEAGKEMVSPSTI